MNNNLYASLKRRFKRAWKSRKYGSSNFYWMARLFLQPVVNIPVRINTSYGAVYHLEESTDDDTLMTYLGKTNLYYPNHFTINHDGLIVDIGAHNGYWIVGALYHWGKTSAIAVEPNPSSVCLMQTHLMSNGLQNRCRVVNAAIGSPNESSLEYYCMDTGSLSNTTNMPELSRITSTSRVPALTINELLNGQTPDLVKCNAEGAEYKVVPQLLSLETRPRYLLLALHPEYGEINIIINMLLNEGYRLSSIGTSKRPYYQCELATSL